MSREESHTEVAAAIMNQAEERKAKVTAATEEKILMYKKLALTKKIKIAAQGELIKQIRPNIFYGRICLSHLLLHP